MPSEEWFREHDHWRGRRGPYKKVLRQFVGYEPKSVMDVGCALGDGLIVASERWPEAHLVGTDVSEVALRKCRERIPGGEFFNWNMNRPQWPIMGRIPPVDLVMCFHTLEHLSGWDSVNLSVRWMCGFANRQVIVAVPYELTIPAADHNVIFREGSFVHLYPAWIERVSKTRLVAIWGEAP